MIGKRGSREAMKYLRAYELPRSALQLVRIFLQRLMTYLIAEFHCI